MNLADVASLATILSLPAAAIGVLYAAVQTRLSRVATSASVMLSASEAFRSAWLEIAKAPDDAQAAVFTDLLNLIEACCAVYLDGLLVGRSGTLLRKNLVNTLVHIDRTPPAHALFAKAMETENTFEEIRRFLALTQKDQGELLKGLAAYAEKAR